MKRQLIILASTVGLGLSTAFAANPVALNTQQDKVSYALGFETGKAFHRHGVNVNTAIFATAVSADVTDYRYAYREGGQTELKAIELPDELSERCVRLSQALGLAFSGIDLIITPDNQAYCLEVNPSPAFNYYETSTGQPIAQAVAQYLAGAK